MISEQQISKWDRYIVAIVDACEHKQLTLTSWESNFIKSIRRLRVLDHELSLRQAMKLGKIYNKVG